MPRKAKQTIKRIQNYDKSTFGDEIVYIFACQCGKEYLNYAALYLHFQRSHQLKISTKLKEHIYEVQKKGNIKTFRYFFSKAKQEDPKVKLEHEPEKFLKQSNAEEPNQQMQATPYLFPNLQNFYFWNNMKVLVVEYEKISLGAEIPQNQPNRKQEKEYLYLLMQNFDSPSPTNQSQWMVPS